MANDKPTMYKPTTDNLPPELRSTAAFCNWQYFFKDGRWTKTPLNPSTLRMAESNNRDTFGTFEQAIKNLNDATGIGVGVFDDLCAIDIDSCVDDEGTLSPLAMDIVNTMGCYTEYSPSKHGIRILFKAPSFAYDKSKYYIMNSGNSKNGSKLDTFNGQQQQLEVYVAGMTNKYVTVTGNTLTPNLDLTNNSAELQIILDKYMLKDTRKGRSSTLRDGQSPPKKAAAPLANWQSVLEDALRTDAEMASLYNMPPEDGQHDDSGIDLALMNKLATRLKGDTAAMRQAFHQSARGSRGKAYREDYVNSTISVALEAWEESKRKQEAWKNAHQPSNSDPIADDGLVRRMHDSSDTGNAIRFKDTYKDEFCYVSEWGWSAWNGKYWDTKANEQPKHCFMKMCDMMLKEAASEMASLPFGQESDSMRKELQDYIKWLLKTNRSATKTKDGLNLAQALMVKSSEMFDANAFDLNTPGGIVDLRTGAIRPNDPKAYCTNMTKYAPSNKPHPMWDEFLRYVTDGDDEFIEYLQTVAGMAAIGQVYYEGLVIAHGTGGNGKSTLFNAIQGAFGTYATSIRPEILMTRKNQSSEATGLIEVKGKRFVLAAETEEGNRLSESVMKRLASTDTISARWLYHDSIVFAPSHTLILCTNHLPKISGTGEGTWRRIKKVPFVKRVESDKTVIRNYAQVMLDTEGGSITQWIIDGAVRFVQAGYDIHIPQVVEEATNEYRHEENWIGNFIAECCETGGKYSESGSILYTTYRQWAEANGEYTRNNRDFAKALELTGYTKRSTMRGIMWDKIKISQNHKDILAGFTPIEAAEL